MKVSWFLKLGGFLCTHDSVRFWSFMLIYRQFLHFRFVEMDTAQCYNGFGVKNDSIEGEENGRLYHGA